MNTFCMIHNYGLNDPGCIF